MKRLHWITLAILTAGAARAATFEEGLALKKENKLSEAERVFAAVVKENPDDTPALEQWATVLGWLGRWDDSISAWKRALAQTPDNPDYQMALARVQYWKGEIKPARQQIEALLAAAPQSADALALAGDICTADHDLACARDNYRHAQAIASSAELEKKLAGAAEPPRYRFDAGGQVDAYDVAARGTEGSLFVQGSWQIVSPLVLSGGYEQLRQFGRVDHRLNFGAYVHPADGLLLTARVAISPAADTVAPWEASAGAEVHVAGPITALTSVRHLDFDTEGVTIVGAGARLDIGRWSLSGQGGAALSTANDAQAFGLGKIEYAFGETLWVYYGLARGRQAQAPQLMLPPAVATDITAGLIWQVERAWAVRLDYTYEKYGNSYVRNSLGSALTFKF